MADEANSLARRLLMAAGAGGLFASGFVAGRATTPGATAAAGPSASAYVRAKPGTYPTPPANQNACYAAGTKTAPLPCLSRVDPQLPMLLGQCGHPATQIADGPHVAQYTGSPAVLCCYKAELPTCSGRPLRVGFEARAAPLSGIDTWM